MCMCSIPIKLTAFKLDFIVSSSSLSVVTSVIIANCVVNSAVLLVISHSL
jgi:hypothetical protein